jgi:type I restriction enzyme S subunit
MSVWRTARLDDCTEIVSGATPSTTEAAFWNGDICWATPKDLSELDGAYISDTPRKITRSGLQSCAATVLPPGSVLFSSRAPIGHVAINTVPMATNQGFKSFVLNTNLVYPKFLYHWLRCNRQFLESLGNGATFKEVSKAVVARIEVPLPPLPEQQRIADILDKAHALRATRRAALAQLDGLIQSVFVDMFGDPATNPKGWPMRAIADLLESASYGTSEKSEATGEFAVLRMNNITRTGETDLSDLKYMNLDASEHDRYLVRTGDVLFNRTNSPELVGKTAIFRETRPMAYAGYLIRLRVNRENDPEYLACFLNTGYAKRVLRGMCKSIIGMANINATEVQAIRIPQPPVQIQSEFAHRVSCIQHQKANHRSSLAKFDALFASLQHRSFRGEL